MTRYDHLLVSRWNYSAGLVLDLICSVTALVAGFASGPRLAASFAAVTAGATWYTLCEYGIHRWLYHHGHTTVSVVHDRHHTDPDEMLGAPFFYSLSIVALHGFVVGVLFGAPLGLTFGGAMLFGYFQQTVIHHSAHRFGALDVLGARSTLRRHHALHHRDGAVNFGVSTALWDRVFVTYHRHDGGSLR